MTVVEGGESGGVPPEDKLPSALPENNNDSQQQQAGQTTTLKNRASTASNSSFEIGMVETSIHEEVGARFDDGEEDDAIPICDINEDPAEAHMTVPKEILYGKATNAMFTGPSKSAKHGRLFANSGSSRRKYRPFCARPCCFAASCGTAV